MRRGCPNFRRGTDNGGSDLLLRMGINLARLRVRLVLTVPERGRSSLRLAARASILTWIGDAN